MLVISFAALLEEAGRNGVYNRGGNITRLDLLFTKENLAHVREHAKAFCFLAFDGAKDAAVADYVSGDSSLPDDSGPDVMVLFTLNQFAPLAIPVPKAGTEITVGTHPVHAMVRMLFEGKRRPALPGLVVFDDLAEAAEAVYLPLDHLDTEDEVRRHLRRVFSDIEFVANGAKPKKFLDDLCVQLHREGLVYERTGRRSIREWMLKSVELAKEHKGDIVSATGLFV
ncbi:hypothetical protein NLX83_03035 [Allokutzneria sp. A3M-2-11 16]|uniref:hypothetical protein n=1 Tax=Allokutzneria sp. A3M-2-11 16 TaxID=2962043 RepID=UPI0020B69DC5|nr:hypothetical protein [Allokutzneria sp. A3M-2-11 16]MCP3798224.1 hypothetical protein [Allokutzneria sp. A3M-2-11 16]